MAEALLFMIGEQMLSKVISLSADELTLGWGFESELKRLEKNLEMVHSLIFDASSNNKTQLRSVQAWLKELNAVAYDAETVLDEFNYETLRRKVQNRKRDKVRAFFSPSENPLSVHQKLAFKITNLNVSVDKIYAEGTKIELTELVGRKDASTTIQNERLTHPFLDDESKVVGREDDILNVVNMLCGSDDDDDMHLSVMAIIGIGGQGKTTLAQLVCKHDKVVRHFNEIIWVCVSKDFEVTRLLNEMVQCLTGKNPQLSNVQAIINNELGPNLKQRRYLLVLDDVWNEEEDKWVCFRNALSGINAARGSRIMVTMRSDQVARTMQTSCNYQLQRLSDEESWIMFKQRAFAEGGAVETTDLVGIGREIVKKCCGLPLAIKVIGSLMYSKESKNDWLSIQNSLLWNTEDNTRRVPQTLKLSYDHLPFSLKRCFVFCSFYPKDAVIGKNELIQKWMALGLLQPSLGSDLAMEDVGEKYFKTLLSSSLLQDAKKDEYETITSCKMHDIVHDLASETAQTDYSTLKSQALVSECVNSPLNLRVLVLVNKNINKLPNSIKKLIHLRYLDISNTSISKLPNSFTKLYNLQTLKLHYLLRVPKNFGNLINLRHLCVIDIMSSWDCVLIGIGQLTCLQTLTFFGVNRERGCHVKELGSLKNLRGDLMIFGLEEVQNYEEAKHALLSEKSRLRALRLCWGIPKNRNWQRFQVGYNDEYVLEGLEPHSNLEGLAIEDFEGRNFPQWMMVESWASRVLGNLVKINLSNCNKCERIPPLGHLQHLRVVEIIGMTNVEAIGPEFYGRHTGGGGGGASSSSGGVAVVTIFPALRELTLRNMPKLDRWSEAVQQSSISMNVFPCLEKLNIKACPSLKTLPSHFPSVTELVIWGIDNSLSLKEMSRTLTSLTSLHLEECRGSEFQSVVEELLGNNRSLRQLKISSCHEFEHLPDNLVALEMLEVRKCDNLTDIHCLPSAREVYIRGCKKLIGLPSLTQGFPVIEKLSIIYCHNMVAIPDMHSHTCLRELIIRRFEKLTCVPKLCKSLRNLQIFGCERLTTLPEKLGKALDQLEISGCNALVSFPDFRYLRKLKLHYHYLGSEGLDYFPWPSSSSSTSSNCDVVAVEEEEEEEEEEENDDIQCLQHLELGGWPKIKSLPEQLQHLSALTYLKLQFFHGVESLPEWLGNLSSLQSLIIWDCKKLKYLPSVEAMRRLTKLSELQIYGCPLLEARCTKGFRPECIKISRNATIIIDGHIIKRSS